MATVVYIDTLFLLNFIINYLILLATGKLSGAVFKRARLALGAAVGALYAVLIFFPHMGWLKTTAFKILSGALMTCVAFGFSKKLPRLFIILTGISFAFGGAVFAVSMIFGGTDMQVFNGAYYLDIDFKMLILIVGISYAVLGAVFNRMGKHNGKNGEVVQVKVRMDDRVIEVNTLCDTGNTLTDPLTNQPILVVDWEISKELLPRPVHNLLSEEGFSNPIELMEQLSIFCPQLRFRLIPYKAVGTGSGLLLCLKTSSIEIQGKEMKGALLAFSPTALADGGNYRALIGTV